MVMAKSVSARAGGRMEFCLPELPLLRSRREDIGSRGIERLFPSPGCSRRLAAPARGQHKLYPTRFFSLVSACPSTVRAMNNFRSE